jgi:hypothetical protein
VIGSDTVVSKQEGVTMAQLGSGKPALSVQWVLGAVLVVQGFGSAVTEALWRTGFGVSGLLRAAGVPTWSDLVVGALGAALLVHGLIRREARKKAARG